jgi:hypothetical protein
MVTYKFTLKKSVVLSERREMGNLPSTLASHITFQKYPGINRSKGRTLKHCKTSFAVNK